MQKRKIYCFGEMLWDIVSDNKYPGGAPLNVAYHLAKFHSDISIISRVGSDDDGKELQRLAKTWDINTNLIQIDDRNETGKVNAIMHANGEVEYDIKSQVAWDYIEMNSSLKDAVKVSDCFVFGSLSARNIETRKTLFELLEQAPYKVFDINLRYPHYDADILDVLLNQADVLKLNNWELLEVNKLLRLKSTSTEEDSLVRTLMENFAVKQVIVTRGKEGAAFYSENEVVVLASESVHVKDTIGCGDAFLAAFIVSFLNNESGETTLQKAVTMGSFLATKEGGCPPYSLSEYESFYESRNFKKIQQQPL